MGSVKAGVLAKTMENSHRSLCKLKLQRKKKRALLEADGANQVASRSGEIKAIICERILFFQLVSDTSNVEVC